MTSVNFVRLLGLGSLGLLFALILFSDQVTATVQRMLSARRLAAASIPPPLSSVATPRPVALSALAWCMGAFATIALATGVVSGGLSFAQARAELAHLESLQQDGVTGTAEVTLTWSSGQYRRRVTPRAQFAGYGIEYKFTHDGQSFTRSAPVSAAAHAKMKAGDRVAIVYLPSAPQINRLQAEPRPDVFSGLDRVLVGLLLSLIWLPVVRAYCLLRWGVYAEATVTSVSRVADRDFAIRLQFADVNQNIVHIRMHQGHDQGVAIGSHKSMVYLRRYPKINMLQANPFVRLTARRQTISA